jgi:hypothetical protein
LVNPDEPSGKEVRVLGLVFGYEIGFHSRFAGQENLSDPIGDDPFVCIGK